MTIWIALLFFLIQLRIEHDTLTVGGYYLTNLAEQFGTPLNVYDRATLDRAVVNYQTTLAEFYPGVSGLTYAGKAFLCHAIGDWS